MKELLFKSINMKSIKGFRTIKSRNECDKNYKMRVS